MASAKSQTAAPIVALGLTIKLSAAAFEALSKSTVNPDKTADISMKAKWLLENYASGGMMLKTSELEQLEKSTGTKFVESDDIVKAVQKGMGRDNGQFTFVIEIDPAFIEPIKEVAKQQGVDARDLVSDAVNTMMHNGWLYEFTPSGGLAHFDRETWKRIQDLTGERNPTGADIARLLTPSESKEAA